MARSGSGDYTAPSNTVNPAATGTTIDPTDFNELVDDVESALSESHFTAATSGTDNAVIRNDGTGGRKLQASAVTIDDSGNMAGVANLTVSGTISGATNFTGSDANVVTGTPGTSGNIATWNADGDVVDGPPPPVGSIVGTSDTQTLTNKTLTAPVINVGSDAQGDIYYRNGSGVFARLAAGSPGQFFKTNGAAADPEWASLPSGGDMLSSNNLSDVASAATAFANIKQAASETSTGVVELATTAEATAGADTSRAITAAGLKAHIDARILDEDDMSSNSATDVPSQQSVKAYVDAQVGGASSASTSAALLGVDEGIAFSFKSRSYTINDYADLLSDAGRPDDILTVSRASSATYVGRDRLLKTASSNELRYDHDPATGVPLGALIEGARTNLFLRSEEIDNASWIKTRANVTANATTAPDGTTTADKVYDDGASGTHIFVQSVSATATSTHSISFWAKAAEYDTIRIQLDNGSTLGFRADFNLSTGVHSSTDISTSGSLSTMTQYSDGWWRCTATGIPSTSGATVRIVCYLNGGGSYLGDGTSGTYFWGLQLEVGAHASSYIPTTSASATRAADSVSIATSAFPVDIDNFTTYARLTLADANAGGSAQRPLCLVGSGVTTDSSILSVNTSGASGYLQYSGSSIVVNTSTLGPLSDGVEFALAASVLPDDVKMDGPGGTATDTSAAAPAALTTLHIGSDGSSNRIFGHVSEVMVINRAMTAAELAELTA